ncbi:Globin, partial [Parelaphostrongylus tenuis]
MGKLPGRLTWQQRRLIMETFKLLDSDPVKTGLRILIKLFSEYPQYKQVWPQFRQIPDSSIMHSDQLREHASVYMCWLRSTVHSMSDDDKLIPQMIRIAKVHKNRNVHRGDLMNMLHPLLETLKECVNGEMAEGSETAWTTFLEVI